MNVSLRQEPVSSFWKRALLFLMSHMNAHMKRVFFLTTLYCRVSRVHRLDDMREDVIHQLNTMLRLARRKEALRMPVLFQGIVWSSDSIDVQIHEEMNREEFDPVLARSISEQLVEASEKAVRYGKQDEMVSDVMEMLRGIFDKTHEPQPAQA